MIWLIMCIAFYLLGVLFFWRALYDPEERMAEGIGIVLWVIGWPLMICVIFCVGVGEWLSGTLSEIKEERKIKSK